VAEHLRVGLDAQSSRGGRSLDHILAIRSADA
jgi:hypothetical protein